MKTISEQKKILNSLIEKKVLPKEKLETFLVPKWELLAPTYGEALQIVLDAIKSSRPLYNWREGKLNSKYLRQSQEKIDGMKTLTQTGDGRFYIIEVQIGTKWKGKSVDEVRKSYSEGEFGLGAFEVACILLTHPEILKRIDDLWLDCPGDEYSPDADGDFSRAPLFYFHDGEVRFRTYWAHRAREKFGSVSAFGPTELYS